MDSTRLMRVGEAAKAAGVKRTTLIAAIGRGEVLAHTTACKLPLVRLPDVKRWAKQTRRSGPKPRA